MKYTALFLLFAIVSCDIYTEPRNNPLHLNHSVGFSVNVITPVTAKQVLSNGYKLHLASLDTRQTNAITIQLLETSPFNSQGEKKIDGVIYTFYSDTYESATGGMEYTYKIWKPLGGLGGICLEHYAQSDLSVSEGLLWDIAKTAQSTQ